MTFSPRCERVARTIRAENEEHRHDLRFLDLPGSVTGLRAKGDALWDASGFVIQPDDPRLQHPANADWLACAQEKKQNREEAFRGRRRKLQRANRERSARGGPPLPLTGGPGYRRRVADAVARDHQRELERARLEYEDYARRVGKTCLSCITCLIPSTTAAPNRSSFIASLTVDGIWARVKNCCSSRPSVRSR